MTKINLPNTTFNILAANQDVQNVQHRVLITGVMLSGTATTGTIVENVGTGGEENALFGAKSHVAALVRAFRAINTDTPIDVIGYTNASGTAATGTIAFSGTATAAGTVKVIIGSNRHNTYELAVAVGDTATAVGAALVAAIGADAYAAVAGVNTTGSVALTAENKGTVGNEIPLAVTGVPAGLTVAITAMSSGATNPTITGLQALIAGRRYHGIVFPGTWAVATLDTIMDARLNASGVVLDGIACVAQAESAANLATWIASLNNPLIIGIGEKKESLSYLKGASHLEVPDNLSAMLLAIRALRLTPQAHIAPYVVSTNNGRDQFGGAHTASLPYFNTPLSLVPVLRAGEGFTTAEIATLKAACVSVIGNNIANNTTITGEIVTTYKTDAAGNPNTSFKYLEAIDTMSQVREYFHNNCRAQYAQCRLTSGNLIPGLTMANEASIRAFIVGLYDDLAADGLVVDGEDAIKYLKRNLRVELDMVTGTVEIDMNVPVVVQLRTILGNCRISFTTGN